MSSVTEPAEPPASNETLAAALLVVISGARTGERFSIGKRLSIGRSSRCDLTLPSQLVSRTHAEIIRTDAGFLLRDLNSANGTVLNGCLISEATLHNDDQIGFGDIGLRVDLTNAEEISAAKGSVVLRSDNRDDGSRIRIHGEPAALQTSLLSKDSARSQRAQKRLEALVSVTQTLARLRELETVYPLIVDEVMGVLPAERGTLLRLSGDTLEAQATRDRRGAGRKFQVSRTIVDEVRAQRMCVLSADARMDQNIDASESIMLQNIRSVLCVPIEYDKELLGILYLDAPGREGMFTEEDLHFVSGIAGVAAVAITNAMALEKVRATGKALNRAYLSMLAVLANAIEARDHYTIGHTWRVARFAQVVARRLGWNEQKLHEVEMGGMLHDIGKIGVPDSILSKPEPLTEEEQERMMLHPQIGARMLRDVPSLRHVVPYVLHHHERYDGEGYPDGLAAEQIPIEARLLSVADTLDAMTSDRPYRRGLDRNLAIAELTSQAGRQFDPAIVAHLENAHQAGELAPYLQASCAEGGNVICPFCSTYCLPKETEIEDGEATCPTCKHRLVISQEGDRMLAKLA